MFHLLVLNLLFLALLSAFLWSGYGITRLSVANGVQNILIMALGFVFSMILGMFYFAESTNVEKVANFGSAKFGVYFRELIPSIKIGALYGLFVALLVSVAVVSIPFYMRSFASSHNFVWLLFAAFIFWFELVTMLSLQWFLPVYALMRNPFLKCLKKSYILFFDNAGFSLALAFVNLLNIVLTILTVGMLPGIHGISLTCTNALRLRLYKYDWYEVNPGMTKEQRRDVPWDDLIANDKKTLGPRKWKSFLFPWKD